jgi:hypothetical protein
MVPDPIPGLSPSHRLESVGREQGRREGGRSFEQTWQQPEREEPADRVDLSPQPPVRPHDPLQSAASPIRKDSDGSLHVDVLA